MELTTTLDVELVAVETADEVALLTALTGERDLRVSEGAAGGPPPQDAAASALSRPRRGGRLSL